MHSYDEAVAQFKQALRVAPKHMHVRLNMMLGEAQVRLCNVNVYFSLIAFAGVPWRHTRDI